MKFAGVTFSVISIGILGVAVWATLSGSMGWIPAAIAFVAGVVVLGASQVMVFD